MSEHFIRLILTQFALLLAMAIGIIFMEGCSTKIVREVEVQEVYLPQPILVPKIDCRYTMANNEEELINYLIECVLNYEAYLETIRKK